MLDFPSLWQAAMPYEDFVAASTEHCGLWVGVYKFARLPEWSLGLDLGATPRRLLVLAEDWCGDASNTIPVLARLVDRVPGLELRVLRRDEHPEVMDEYLTDGARSIPMVIVLDAAFRELGHWGPRPTALQAWVMANRDRMPKGELYPQARQWYARDRGDTTLREVLTIATGSAIPAPEAAPTRAPG
jgi:hypothetical protein